MNPIDDWFHDEACGGFWVAPFGLEFKGTVLPSGEWCLLGLQYSGDWRSIASGREDSIEAAAQRLWALGVECGAPEESNAEGSD